MKRLTPPLRAFTLIELLIVITIIGILAVALIPRLTGGPARARDATRKTDLQQIATALEFYAQDHSGQYPATGSGACVSDISTSIDDYMTTVPSEPVSGNGAGSCSSGYGYTAITISSIISGYTLTADLETTTSSGDGIYEQYAPGSTTTYAAQIGSKTECAGSCTDPIYTVGR